MMNRRIAAIIPARGGSKGIPRKNLIDFCGAPLLYWTILQAQMTPGITDVYVSSDSTEILEFAGNNGAKTIVRPVELSGDKASSESALAHALSNLGYEPDALVFLQATSPLRKPDDLDRALENFFAEKLDSLFSAAILEDFLIWEQTSAGEMQSFNYDYRARGRRQDRLPQFVENGSFYLMTPSILRAGNRLGGKIGLYMMDFWQSFELDSLDELDFLQMLFESKLQKFYKGRMHHE